MSAQIVLLITQLIYFFCAKGKDLLRRLPQKVSIRGLLYLALAGGPDCPAKAIVLTISPDCGVIYSPLFNCEKIITGAFCARQDNAGSTSNL
jgi:hypothetical protein